MQKNLLNLDFVIDSYFEWKDEKGDFKKHVEQKVAQIKKDAKKRASDSKSDK